MNLNLETWESVKVRDVCEKVQKVDIKKQSGIFNYIDIGSIDSELKRVSVIQPLDWQNASSRARQIIKKSDILFSTVRVNLERIAFLEKEIPNGIASTGFTVLRVNSRIIPEFLFYSVIVSKFVQRIVALQKGTAYPAVTNKIVLNQQIPLPPLEEQKRIAALFQSIDAAIEQTEAQEKNLRNLVKKLTDDIVNDNPKFGIILENVSLRKVTWKDFAIQRKKRIDPVNDGIEKIVAGEHLESNDFKIRNWGIVNRDFLGPAFHILFEPGDILYGSRRTYLRKVSVPHFRGVCANTTYVVRANENIILQDFLKYLMLSEKFTQYSISASKGSTNPYINWKDLDDFTCSLPSLEIQRQIVLILDYCIAIANEIRKQSDALKYLKQNLLDEILGD